MIDSLSMEELTQSLLPGDHETSVQCPLKKNKEPKKTIKDTFRWIIETRIFKRHWHSSLLETAPQIKDDEVLIKISATSANRDDLLQTKATNGSTMYPGIECSGIIVNRGKNVQSWQIGQRVCAILKGGGYANQVVVREDLVLPVPDIVSLEDAASLPYATCIIWLALFQSHKQETLEGKSILIHDAASKIGLMAIQFAKYKGLKVIVTTGSTENFAICRKYGADVCINNTVEDFVATTLRETEAGTGGVNFILDFGASNFLANVTCCAVMSEVVIVDLHGPKRSQISFSWPIMYNIKVRVISMQKKSLKYMASAIDEVRMHMWPAIEQLQVVPVIYARFFMSDALKAHEFIKKKENSGSIILLNDFDNNVLVRK